MQIWGMHVKCGTMRPLSELSEEGSRFRTSSKVKIQYLAHLSLVHNTAIYAFWHPVHDSVYLDHEMMHDLHVRGNVSLVFWTKTHL